MSLSNRDEEELNNYLPLKVGKLSGNINLSYNRIFHCLPAIDSTDPVSNGVLDNTLKKYINYISCLVN